MASYIGTAVNSACCRHAAGLLTGKMRAIFGNYRLPNCLTLLELSTKSAAAQNEGDESSDCKDSRNGARSMY